MYASRSDCGTFKCVAGFRHLLAQDLQGNMREVTDQHTSANEMVQFVESLRDVLCIFNVPGTDSVKDNTLGWNLNFRDHRS